MVSKIFLKWGRVVATVIIVPIFICIVCLTLSSCIFPHDQYINDSQAIAIAKNDFGCEKILWISTSALSLSGESEYKLEEIFDRNRYVYCVIGEKDGEELFIIIPSEIYNKPLVSTWAFDYSFCQVVDKFNECGARYVAEVSDGDDYFDKIANGDYIDVFGDINGIGYDIKNHFDYYKEAIEVDFDTFFARLDVKAVFHYSWIENQTRYSCIVTQENGELKAYKKSAAS